MANNFPDFMLQKLQEYERAQGKRVSQQAFADHLGVSRQLISGWMNGDFNPSAKNIAILADKLGPEVYDALGILGPDPLAKVLQEIYKTIPEDDKDAFVQFVEEAARDRSWVPGSIPSPEPGLPITEDDEPGRLQDQDGNP